MKIENVAEIYSARIYSKLCVTTFKRDDTLSFQLTLLFMQTKSDVKNQSKSNFKIELFAVLVVCGEEDALFFGIKSEHFKRPENIFKATVKILRANESR